MRASRTLGITAITAALGATVVLGAQSMAAGHHAASPAHIVAASTAIAHPADDPWEG